MELRLPDRAAADDDFRGGRCSLAAITAVAFNHSGQYMSYAISYDWAQGHAGNKPGLPNKVLIHTCQEEEVRKRPKK